MPTVPTTSIVDYLGSAGKDSSFDARTALAKENGITGYTGSAAQNTQLLGILQGGGAPAPSGPVQPPAPVNSIPATALGTSPSTYSSYFPPPSAAAGLSESAIASKDAYLASTAKEADQLTTDQAAGKSAISGIFSKLAGRATAKADAYESTGLNNDKRAIDELTSQIESRGRAYDKQILDVTQNNPEGKLASGIQNETNRLSGQKASELADMAIVLNAKTRNYATAESILNQKVDAETEDLRTSLAGLQFFYQENASNLNKDQQTLLADKIRAADQEYQDARDMRTKIGSVQLEAAKNGAPVSVVRAIGSATTLEDAIKSTSGYLKPPKSATGSDTYYSAGDKRDIQQAGLSGADVRAQTVFINTPPEFRAAFIRNGSGTSGATAQNILNSLAEWEAYQAQQKKAAAGSDIQGLADQLRAGG